MTRTSRSKLTFALLLFLLTAGSLAALVASDWNRWLVAGTILLLLAPGRIHSILWRSFYRGKGLQARGRVDEAIAAYRSFIELCRERPWIDKTIWLAWSFHTFSAEAMARNNVGGCLLALGELESAGQEFERATELDRQSPVSHFNLALLHEIHGNRPAAAASIREAHRLGLRRASIEEVVALVEEFRRHRNAER